MLGMVQKRQRAYSGVGKGDRDQVGWWIIEWIAGQGLQIYYSLSPPLPTLSLLWYALKSVFFRIELEMEGRNW